MLFLLDAETLFFVNDDQTQVTEPNVLRQNAMRPDDNIDFARDQSIHHFVLLILGAEAA
jgi:hypothetical protein